MAADEELAGQTAQRINAARQGSTEAMGQLLEPCRQYLLLVANEEIGDQLAGKVSPSDLVQETFLEAQRDFQRFQGNTEAELLGWLRRILLNNLLNERQKWQTQKRTGSAEAALADVPLHELSFGLIDPQPSPGAQAIAREQDEELDRAMTQLPEHYREILLLRHRDRLPFEAIGEKLGCSAAAASKLWGRAVAQLRRMLRPPGEPR